MRKRIMDQNTEDASVSNQHWLNAEALAEVEVTSEDAAYPIESGLLSETAAGWRAAQPGPQTAAIRTVRSCVSSTISALPAQHANARTIR